MSTAPPSLPRPEAEPAAGSPPVEPLRRLDRRMIWVDAIQMVISLVPTFVAVVIFDIEPRPSVIWPAAVVAVIGFLTAGHDLFRWLKTRYRVTGHRVERHSGFLVRSTLSVPRDRIRSVDTTANLKQRLAGLRVVTIGTGQNASTGEGMIELNAVSKATAAELRRVLLADRLGAEAGQEAPADDGRETLIAGLKRHWLLYNMFNIWAFVTAMFVIWSAYWLLNNVGVDLNKIVLDLVDWEALGPGWTIAIATAAVALVGAAGLTMGFVSEFWNFRLTRVRTERGTTLRTSNGLLKTREVNRDDHRLRGVHLAEPLFWRWIGAADTAVISTGLAKAGLGSEPASTILPRCPVGEARRVAAAVLDDGDLPFEAPLRAHPRAALRRRVVWAVNTSLVLTGLLLWFGLTMEPLPDWLWLAGVATLPVTVFLAVVAYRSLGHTIVGRYLVTRCGLLTRSTDALQRRAVIGWKLRQSLLQRRLGLITVIATTAAGYGRYRAPDMDVRTGLAFADEAAPGMLSPFLRENTD
ncbi:PH domain-containing protein [Nonomuraea sp. NPDC051941]|uniref:PH domain-containing protein n=1 Tax=Nonomuraea sp. NPDC051941 TaxID=3364373 RepID=UPI0037C9AAC6